jgi:hypothetical protein
VRGLSTPYEIAAAAIDDANADDPQLVEVRGRTWPLALVHGVLATSWVDELLADADDAVRLAARAHHLRRWEVPRRGYPEGRAGYLRWRADQKARHARDVAGLLHAAGYGAASIGRVQSLIRRESLRTDTGAQAVEDAACLVFVETQLAAVADRFDRGHLLEVIRKTARKMSPAGCGALTRIPLDDVAASLLRDALA